MEHTSQKHNPGRIGNVEIRAYFQSAKAEVCVHEHGPLSAACRLEKLLAVERSMDTVVWQLLASVICPGYTIHSVVALVHAGLLPVEVRCFGHPRCRTDGEYPIPICLHLFASGLCKDLQDVDASCAEQRVYSSGQDKLHRVLGIQGGLHTFHGLVMVSCSN